MRQSQINIAIHAIARVTAQHIESQALREHRAEQLFGMCELAHLVNAPESLTTFLDEHRTSLEGGDLAALKSVALLHLPPEFLVLCKADGITPETVLRGFIADLCSLMNYVADPRTDGYSSNGSDERDMARAYYERVGYPYLNKEA
jgi:hypothetical protein